MSILKKHAGKSISITGYIGARVSADLERAFKEHCLNLGIDTSEALRLLVENELQSTYRAGQLIGTSADMILIDEYARADKQARPSVESLPAAAQEKPENENKSNAGRFTVSQWKREGLLPCPICWDWKSAANFSRHAQKEHNFTTKELFTEYASQADKMTAAYDNKKSAGL